MLEKPIVIPGYDPHDQLGRDASYADPDSATRDAVFDLIDTYLWPCAYAFVGGCFFTVGLAWVWSWFL